MLDQSPHVAGPLPLQTASSYLRGVDACSALMCLVQSVQHPHPLQTASSQSRRVDAGSILFIIGVLCTTNTLPSTLCSLHKGIVVCTQCRTFRQPLPSLFLIKQRCLPEMSLTRPQQFHHSNNPPLMFKASCGVHIMRDSFALPGCQSLVLQHIKPIRRPVSHAPSKVFCKCQSPSSKK